MLDFESPNTDYIFKAAALEDRIRALLVQIKSTPGTNQSSAREEIVDRWIPELRALNRESFGNHPGINATLGNLEYSVNELSLEECWQAFLLLAEQPGENFGTWAI
ncbi:hypothetical protein [Zooshikella ganghwensis]|uniref:Uncharacterized protein n=1 Tax=Zooshikella ganghwensis TaxID=202772 RepID=A0A4P9VK85_9GAMM|nr:hypothetical protein [Zooshikella ganghwensis]RDH43708.1 hypothetical protein B9G39_09795 [Zooshikella ganghwensis]